MSWENDGPCRHKRQRPQTDSPAFWNECAESDWVINGASPAFITASNEKRSAGGTTGGYSLRTRVGRSVPRFTQSEACGYESNFADQLQEDDDEDDDEDNGVEAGGDVGASMPASNQHNSGSDDGNDSAASDAGSYQDESEESSSNEYHPGERDHTDGEEKDDEDDSNESLSDFDIGLDLDEELDLLVCDGTNIFDAEIDHFVSDNTTSLETTSSVDVGGALPVDQGGETMDSQTATATA
jgi:hypothetical protein